MPNNIIDIILHPNILSFSSTENITIEAKKYTFYILYLIKYADDSAIVVQDKDFETVKRKLTCTLAEMDEYLEINSLRPNPTKTEVCPFHLRNKEANQKLHVTWKGIELANNPNPLISWLNLRQVINI